MEYLWQSSVVDQEPILFAQLADGPPQGQLLMPAAQITAATNCGGDVAYEQGRDFVVASDGRTLTLPAGSRIVFQREDELYPVKGAAGVGGGIARRRDNERAMLFSEDDLFASLQTRFTYRHAGWSGPVPESAMADLPKTRRLLGQQKRLRVALWGDSISAGSNATKLLGVAPYHEPFSQQVVEALAKRFDAKVQLANESQGGKDSKWGLENIDRVIQHQPDLVILGWGMNDGSLRRSADELGAILREQMQAVQAAQPETEFLLIASMTANPQWNGAAYELYDGYRRTMLDLCGQGVGLADVMTLWRWMLTRKQFVDLTGNGLNHPNDFGHGLYAQVITAAIIG